MYFERTCVDMSSKSILNFFKPKPQNLLLESSNVDQCTVDLCNDELDKIYSSACSSTCSETESTPKSSKRGIYQILSPADRAEVRKYASQYSTPQTIAHFTDRFQLKSTSVRNLKSKYLKELSRKRKLFDESDSSECEINELRPAKRGKPLILGHELDNKVKNLIVELRNKG